MKITVDLLKKLKACLEGIAKFNNTVELHDIDLTKNSEIIVGDQKLFSDINWLIKNLRGKLKINKLIYKINNTIFYEYTYDEKGNRLTSKNSDGYREKWTYDDKGNMLTYENSYGDLMDYSKLKYDLTLFEIK